ncbi:cytochrome C [Bacillus sp. FJAT-27445]|uniref:cytochrome C n=1 Tax=Bacillus sp. FJAT-27445 TaxID=1679166 RepID=UPI0007436FFA|nr:cytochrome C [Bacillus sp. FJAT-27445]
MKGSILTFIICTFLGLGVGYVVFEVINGSGEDVSKAKTEQASPQEAVKEDNDQGKVQETSTSADSDILSVKGCLGCHSVEGLNLQGGATGPDLTNAFKNVEGKHGKPINEFMKEPTSAVMSGVIGGNPLKDEEITQIVDLLKLASEKK